LSEAEAEAVSVYLAFILSKVVNYNSVNTFWHYGRLTVAQTFSRHDFAFRTAFSEFEGARETVMWGASQVINAYEQLAGLIHGEPVSLEGAGDEGGEDEPLDDESVGDEDTGDEKEGEVQEATALFQRNGEVHLRPEVIVPTVTCDDAAALSVPAPGTVHLICVDPPYYNNVQYSELSNFFYVWLKRALHDVPGLAHLFREPLAESNREAVANAARWQREAEAELTAWQTRYNTAVEALRAQNVKAKEAKTKASVMVGPKPLSAKERADRFYEDKMAAVFRRAKQLLHPAGRMVVMFNHKETWAWRLEQIFSDLTNAADFADVGDGFSADAVDRDTQTLWLWLDTFQGETAQSDDVRKLAKSLNVNPDDFKRMGLLNTEKDLFVLRPPQAVDLRLLARRLQGEEAPRGRAAREADVWEERIFPNFVGAAVWNAIALMMGADGEHRGVEAVRRWLRESGYGVQQEFRGAFAVTLRLLDAVFSQRPEGNEWREASRQARRTWDLVLHSWKV
jgi:hypothetical protein